MGWWSLQQWCGVCKSSRRASSWPFAHLWDVLGFLCQLALEHTAMFIHDRHLPKLVKNLVILECSFHKLLSKRKNRKKERKHLFMCSKPRTFGVTLKSLFNMLPKTLFMSFQYDTSHICTASKQQLKRDKKVLLHIQSPYHLLCANSLHVLGMLYI